MAEQLVYDDMLENILRPFRPRLTTAVIDRLKAVGVDASQKLKPTYPARVHEAALEVVAKEFFPSVPLEVACQRVGELVLDRYIESTLGKAVLAVIRMLGPRPAVKRLPQTFRMGNNFVDAKIIDLVDDGYTVEIRDGWKFPTFWVGMILKGNVMMGLKDATVELLGSDANGSRIRVRWNLKP
jgi:uncharacterized protein (TIGR02265 family)